MTTKNPFPGMNPFLERNWPDVHTKLISYIADVISDQLPLDLRARAEEGLEVVDEGESQSGGARPDVAIIESWKLGIPPSWTPDEDLASTVTVAEPFLVPVAPLTERWIEIHDSGGTLVTVIEVLSPTNKRPPGNRDYLAKQSRYLNARVNLVEIDLIRAGSHVLPFDPQILKGDKHGAAYHVCVCPAHGYASKEIYPIHLRSRLPAFTIPLRAKDKRVVLDLQPLVDRAYEKGRHWQDNFTEALVPQLSTEDLSWANERLLEAGLIQPKAD